MPDSAPLLTISVPTHQRVDLLERCLASLAPAARWPGMMEVVVNDNSADSDTERLVERFAAASRVPVRYYRNPPGTGAVGNFNRCIERASGRYHLILHDDDYLLPGAIDGMLRILRAADHVRDKVLLFGVKVVDLSGKAIRHQRFKEDRFLEPSAALRRLLGNASFVRVPGLVVQNQTYREVGGFRAGAFTTCDFDIEVRLFSRFGVRCVPQVTSAYTVHPGAMTTTVFTPRTIALCLGHFATARASGELDSATIDRLQCDWFHQFILAGTWRALRQREWRAARGVYALFDLPEIRAQGTSLRWLPVRIAFALLSGALWRRAPRHSSSAAITREW